ncbi:MAG: prepilin peptidase [Nitrososphaerales archaeon]
MIEYRIAVSLAMLIYASYLDLKSREVDDKPWIFFSLIGVSFSIIEFMVSGTVSDWFLALLSIGMTGPLAFVLYYLGFYGGADAKALVTLSFILPVYRSPMYLHAFTPVTVLTNATVLVLALPVYFLLRNSFSLIRGESIFSGFEEEPRWKKAAVLFLGYRLKNVKENDFYLPLEKTFDDGTRRFDLTLLKDEDEFLHGRDVWGTPGIPLLLFMTGGFIAMLLFGDFVAIFLNTLVSVLIL